MKKTLVASAMSIAMTFNAGGIAFADGGIIQGDVAVYKEGKVIETIAGKNPVVEGALHECISPCTVKSEGVTLAGAEKTKLAVKSEVDKFNMFVSEGKVDFVVTDPGKEVNFYLPDNTVTNAVPNAGSGKVTGTFSINEAGQAEIAVNEGSMTFTTAEGTKVVEAGQMMRIEFGQVVDSAVSRAFKPVNAVSQVTVGQQAAAAGISAKAALVSGAVVLGGAGAAAIIANPSDDASPNS